MPAAEVIRSRSNPLVRAPARPEGARRRGDLALLEGAKLVEEALAAGVAIVEVAAAPRRTAPRGPRLVGRCSRGASVRGVDDAVLASLSETETSQGVLAIARRPSFDEERALPRRAAGAGRGRHPEPRQPGRACCARPRPRAPPAPT